MSIWPALLLAPSLVLIDVSLAHALATPSCASQSDRIVDAVIFGSLALAAAFTAVAGMEVRRLRSDPADAVPDGTLESGERRRFMAGVAFGTGALSCLVIVAVGIPQWVLSPCLA